MTVAGTDYYMATEEFVGSNFYSPFVTRLPRIEWSGDGWLKTRAGQVAIVNNPDEDQHPFGYATNYQSLITNPDQKFSIAIHPGEPEEKRSLSGMESPSSEPSTRMKSFLIYLRTGPRIN